MKILQIIGWKINRIEDAIYGLGDDNQVYKWTGKWELFQ